jgi:hypothetical protein
MLRGFKLNNFLNLSNEPQELHPDTPIVKPIPEEGKRVLALLKGEWIVLEVGCESPTYEETFTPFLYWFEPYNDMHSIEYYDVTTWQKLPEFTVVGGAE